jgi:hypothetical protein
MMLLTGVPPVRYEYANHDVAGAVNWFLRAGCGLVFDDFDEDGDDALA